MLRSSGGGSGGGGGGGNGKGSSSEDEEEESSIMAPSSSAMSDLIVYATYLASTGVGRGLAPGTVRQHLSAPGSYWVDFGFPNPLKTRPGHTPPHLHRCPH